MAMAVHGRRYDLVDLPRAQRQFVVRGHTGKIVIAP